MLGLASLRLQPFPACVMIARGTWHRLLADPRRTPVIRRPAVLAAALGEACGSSSRRLVELLVRSFGRGTPSVPWPGMQAVPDQLAARLPQGVLRLSVRVAQLARGEVRTAEAALCHLGRPVPPRPPIGVVRAR